MTTTSIKPVRTTEPANQVTRPETRHEHPRRLGREIGTLAVNMYERGIADIVAFEKDAAKITPYRWAKNVLTVSAGLIEDVGSAYVKTARLVLR